MQSVSKNPLIATFQLSSAASLNLGRSQNGVLGNELTIYNVGNGVRYQTINHLPCYTNHLYEKRSKMNEPFRQ